MVKEQLQQEHFKELYEKIRKSSEILIKHFTIFDNIQKKHNSKINKSMTMTLNLLEQKKILIYQEFFNLQNLINEFLSQEIKITAVYVDPITGQREIRLMDNDIKNIQAVEKTSVQGYNYAKLEYDMNQHYENLKNALPDDDNKGLQNTAMQVELRYNKYKKRILWYKNQWKGYTMSTRGPINEAFVSFYINNIKFNSDLETNIDYFMLDPTMGAINADNMNGFLIGDVSGGKIQYAVKGEGGSPQKYTTIIKWLKILKDKQFSPQSFADFINRFTIEEKEKRISQVKELSQKSIDGLVRYHGEKLTKELVFNKK